MDAASQRLIREHNGRAWLAWQTAGLTAYAPAKGRDFIKLEALQATSEPTAKPKQTPEQQIAVLKSVMAARRR